MSVGKKKVPEWLGTGDCSKCTHKNKCYTVCEPHENRANAYIKKALLMKLERRNAIC